MNVNLIDKQAMINHSFLPLQTGEQGLDEYRAIAPKRYLPTIESIATGTPNNVIPQSDAAKVVANLPHMDENRDRIEKLYSNTRIDRRRLAIDLLSDSAIAFTQHATIQERMQMFKDHAVPLAERVVKQALDSASAKLQAKYPGCDRTIEESINLIVFVSSTGFIAPGVDTDVIRNLGLRRDMARVTVNFMGCAAAMNGLRVACDHVRSHPNHKALVVCLELSSVNAAFEDTLNDVIIHSIFGDGCAAVVVGAIEEQSMSSGTVVIQDHLSYLVEDTEDGITLGVRDNGITCQLSRQLPDYIEAGVNPIIEQFLARHSLTKQDIDLWAVHPGGTRIIQKSQRSLGLDDSQVVDSWEVLRQYGNMLSPSVLFVLERMLNRSGHSASETDRNMASDSFGQDANRPGYALQPSPRGLNPLTGIAFSFSPGVGVEGILFQKV